MAVWWEGFFRFYPAAIYMANLLTLVVRWVLGHQMLLSMLISRQLKCLETRTIFSEITLFQGVSSLVPA